MYYGYGGYYPSTTEGTAKKIVKIDGKGHVEFDIKDDLHIVNQDYWHQLDMDVVVTEELTGAYILLIYLFYKYMTKKINHF